MTTNWPHSVHFAVKTFEVLSISFHLRNVVIFCYNRLCGVTCRRDDFRQVCESFIAVISFAAAEKHLRAFLCSHTLLSALAPR